MDDQFHAAVDAYGTGRRSDAASLCEAILTAQPAHADALHLLGVMAHETGNNEFAGRLIEEAIRHDRRAAHYQNNLGTVRQAQGRHDEAILCFRQALALQPRYAKAHFNLGNAHLALGDLDEAAASFERALAFEPGFAEAYFNLATVLQRQHRLDAAIARYRQAIAVRPNYTAALCNLGTALEQNGDTPAAIEAFERVLAMDSDHVAALNNLGTALLAQGDIAAALSCYERALANDPSCVDARINLGNARQAQGNLAAAAECYDRAVAAAPDDVRARNNLAVALQHLGRVDGALACFDAALARHPDDAELQFNRALALLLSGRLAEGWEALEWRWRDDQLSASRREFDVPLWTGEPLDGRRILLHAEQGFGDALMFMRYAPLVARRGGRVLLEVPRELVELCRGLPGIERLLVRGDEPTGFDLHCPLLSLPRAFGTILTTIPADVPYLRPPAGKPPHILSRLADRPRPWVGLCWAGNSKHRNDRNRSVPFAELAPILDAAEAGFVSLQKDRLDAAARDAIDAERLLSCADNLASFAGTAAVIERLDLVISVDTAVAHLAGALAKPCWVLLPYAPDWRWMLGREDSPWYPTLHLFRQPSPGRWDLVVARVASELAALARSGATAVRGATSG